LWGFAVYDRTGFQDSPEELLEKMNGDKIEFDEPKHFYM
jgi:hypothetical protein